MPVESDDEIRKIFSLDRIAVVGCSATPGKAAHEVPKYMRERGFEIVPVNPSADEIFGEPSFESLASVPDGIDVVNVFRPSDEVGGIVELAVERDDIEVLWTQLGIRDPVATRRAERAGIDVVVDRCMKIEHARLIR